MHHFTFVCITIVESSQFIFNHSLKCFWKIICWFLYTVDVATIVGTVLASPPSSFDMAFFFNGRPMFTCHDLAGCSSWDKSRAHLCSADMYDNFCWVGSSSRFSELPQSQPKNHQNKKGNRSSASRHHMETSKMVIVRMILTCQKTTRLSITHNRCWRAPKSAASFALYPTNLIEMRATVVLTIFFSKHPYLIFVDSIVLPCHTVLNGINFCLRTNSEQPCNPTAILHQESTCICRSFQETWLKLISIFKKISSIICTFDKATLAHCIPKRRCKRHCLKHLVALRRATIQ